MKRFTTSCWLSDLKPQRIDHFPTRHYIELNPVRAGIVTDPTDYRWSSDAEAVSGGKKSPAGLVCALRREGTSNVERSTLNAEVTRSARAWAQGGVGKEYRKPLLAAGREVVVEAKIVKKGMPKEQAKAELAALASHPDSINNKGYLVISKVIRHRIRYFSDEVVVGSKDFVDTFFKGSRKRFGPNRTSGSSKPRGALSPPQESALQYSGFSTVDVGAGHCRS